MSDWACDYEILEGCGRDRALLLRFLRRSYQELFPDIREFSHLATTVERYLSSETPLWWAVLKGSEGESSGAYRAKIACLWMGNAIPQGSAKRHAQVEGDRYAHIFLLYVAPEHRCRGIGSALMQKAEDWAKLRGDRQIGLQVFCENRPALSLYRRLGYREQSLLMVKQLPNSKD